MKHIDICKNCQEFLDVMPRLDGEEVKTIILIGKEIDFCVYGKCYYSKFPLSYNNEERFEVINSLEDMKFYMSLIEDSKFECNKKHCKHCLQHEIIDCNI